MLYLVYALNNEITAFVAQKGFDVPKIHVDYWLNPNCTLLPIQFEISSFIGSI